MYMLDVVIKRQALTPREDYRTSGRRVMSTTTASRAEKPEGTMPTPLRTGESFLADLRAGERKVFVDGERISDPTRHPAFMNGARSLARLFDFAAAPENRERMTFTSPDTGGAGVALLPDPAHACGPARQAHRRGENGRSSRSA